ncbi:hypothetical protein FPV67DRAFT_1467872 [Lyophyllum atratum]|nr:hypothetical protein FPV67DRAFT_1467872 [Lyophyllum atratum]
MRRPSTASFYARPLSRAKSSSAASAATPVTAPTDENASPAKSPVIPDIKEDRAREHERQRHKKASGFVKTQARKELQAQGGFTVKPYERHSTPRTVARFEDDGEEPACEESEVDWDDVSSPVRSPRVEQEREPVSGRPEVPLADLLISRKPRHGREPDFEVVPPIRSVIVLDDSAAPDIDFNEPWEHVYADDSDASEPHAHEREPSYAKIASLS